MLLFFRHHKNVQKKWIRLVSIMCITAAVLFTVYGILLLFFPEHMTKLFQEQHCFVQSAVTAPDVQQSPKDIITPDWVTKDFLTPNEYSRPQTPLLQVNAIVIHYVGNPGTTAQNNRNYFEALSITEDTYASSHFVIGLDGEIIQCIPLNEIAYCSNDRNDDTISIECCHPDADGRFNEETRTSLIRLTAWLCETYGLNPAEDVIRHYDVTGKVCPKYYVDHPDAWAQLLLDFSAAMN